MARVSCFYLAIVALVLTPLGPMAWAMDPVTDESLDAIHGTGGVQLTLRLRNNISESGAPEANCFGGLNPCRMGIEFSGRNGIWLMLKDYYGVLEINDILLDGAELPVANTTYLDESRFRNQQGACLIGSCNPAGTKALRVRYPFSKGQGQYEDMMLFVNIGRTALEFDDIATDPVTPGYMRDNASGSVLGFRMSDSAGLNSPSRAKFMGDAYVFGF